MMVSVAALGIEPTALGERLEKGRLAAAVLTDEQCDVAPEGQSDPA